MEIAARAVTIGKFDGLHIGHTKLIDATVNISAKFGLKSTAYIINSNPSQTITDKDHKNYLLHCLGIDEVICHNLNDGIKDMMPEDFVKAILVGKLNAHWVIVGENFRFGKGRCADAQDLKKLCRKYNIETLVADTVYSDDENIIPISSTLIRDLILRGDMESVCTYLGRPYSIKGIVKDGKHLGRKLGFPTINVNAEKDILLPANGVYATLTTVEEKVYQSITNVGNNPTIDNLECARTETHLFNESIDCYGKKVTIQFLKFIREEKHFTDEKELAYNISNDKKKVIEYFRTREDDGSGF